MSKIIAAYHIESCCRTAMALATHRDRCALPVRTVIAASVLAGNSWVSVRDVQETFPDFKKDRYDSGATVERLKCFGIVDSRRHFCDSRTQVQMKLNCDLFDADHFHGQASTRIRTALDIYCPKHPSTTHLIGLVLLGVYLYQIQDSRNLGRFLGIDAASCLPSSTPSRLLNKLADARLLSIMRNSARPSRPFFVNPVEQ